MRSSVIVLLEVSTSEASVDIEADSTSSTTRAMMTSGRVTSIEGTMLSKASLPLGSTGGMPNKRPKPPRK